MYGFSVFFFVHLWFGGFFMCNGCVKISLGAKLRPVTSALFIYTKVVIYQGVCSCKLKCKSCRFGLNVEWMCCLLQYPYAKIICQKSVCKCFAVFLWAIWCVGSFSLLSVCIVVAGSFMWPCVARKCALCSAGC